MTNGIVEVNNLVKKYGNTYVLNDISLTIYEGEIFGLLGPNGAGKSTLMECIVGLRPHDYGEVLVNNMTLENDWKRIKSVIGFVPQEPLLYKDLTVRENLSFYASMYGVSKSKFSAVLEKLISYLEMEDFMNKRIKVLSGGQKKRAGIAASLIHDPQILILDEPTTGLDPNVRREFWNFIRRLNEDGKTIIISTHYMDEADELCDRVAIIDRGEILIVDAPSNLKKKYGGSMKIAVHVKTKYLNSSIEALREVGGELHVDRIIIPDKDESFIPVIKERLHKNKIYPESIEVKMPTLEDVFVHLTGRGLE